MPKRKDLEEKEMKSNFDILVESILNEGKFDLEKKEGLHGWFKRKIGSWIDCKASKKGKLVPCGRQKGEKRKGYPACRPTLSACNSRKRLKKGSKRISWKKGDKT